MTHPTSEGSVRGHARGGAAVKAVVALALLGGAAGGAAWAMGWIGGAGGDAEPARTKEVAFAEVASFDITTTASGELQAIDQLEIRSPLERETKIVEIVDEGSFVESGAVLAVLNSDAIRTELEDDEIALESERAELIAAENALEIQKSDNESSREAAELKLRLAELALEQWREGDRALKMQELGLGIEEARREAERLEEKHQRNQGLLEEGFISEDQFKQDHLSLIKARARVETATLQLASYTDYQQVRDREQKESDVSQAQAELGRVERQNTIRLADKTADLTSKQRRVARREQKVGELRAQIEAATIKAPTSGLVVYGTTIELSRRGWSSGEGMQIGQEVYPNQLMFVLPDTSKLEANVRVHESLAGRIAPGQSARVRVDAANDRVFSGTVTKIGVLAENGGWRDPNLREYTVTITMQGDNGGGVLKPSMRCEAEVQLGRVENALSVPVAALYSDGAVRYVHVPSGPLYRRVPVKMGRVSDTHAEVLAGIEQGVSVLVRAPEPGELASEAWDEAALKLVGFALDEDGNPVPAAEPAAPAAAEAPAAEAPATEAEVEPASFSENG
jgi:multidrug efflux pump subunit AcrA (membrane-fusion protein)